MAESARKLNCVYVSVFLYVFLPIASFPFCNTLCYSLSGFSKQLVLKLSVHILYFLKNSM